MGLEEPSHLNKGRGSLNYRAIVRINACSGLTSGGTFSPIFDVGHEGAVHMHYELDCARDMHSFRGSNSSGFEVRGHLNLIWERLRREPYEMNP